MSWIWEVIFVHDISDVAARRVVVSAQTAEQAIEKVCQRNSGSKTVVIGVKNMAFCDGRLVYKGGH